jgi:uncharacterized protein involved in exopolysaccharide biosynthesis
MLQNTTNDWVNRDNLPSPEFHPVPTVSLLEVVAFLRRHLSVISLTCLATLGIAIIYLIIATPKFTANANLIINSKTNTNSWDPAAVTTIVESQIEIIKSESIARAVIEKLALAEDPEFARGLGSGMISRLLGWSKPDAKASIARYAVESFERKLLAKRVGQTYLVQITFESRDPDRAAQIVNAVAEKYITYQINNSGLQDVAWAKDRLNELITRASAAQKALEDYSRNGKDTADSSANIDKLAAAAESSKAAYENFRHALRKMEATQEQSSLVFEASLLTGASPPLRASWPNARIVLGAAMFVGALLGIAVGILRDLLEIRAIGREPRLSTQDDGTERSIPDAVRDPVRPDHQSETSAKTRPAVRFTGSG